MSSPGAGGLAGSSRRDASLVLLSAAGGALLWVAVSRLLRALVGKDKAAPAAPPGPAPPVPYPILDEDSATPLVNGRVPGLRRASSSTSFHRSPRLTSSGFETATPFMRRNRSGVISSTGRSRASEAFVSSQSELATDNALAMLRSDKEEFRLAETVLFITEQCASDDVVSQVQRVVTPSEKLQSAFRRVSAGIALRNALRPQDSEAPEAPRNPAFLDLRPIAPVPRALLLQNGAADALAGCGQWDWDVFALAEATGDHALVALGLHLLSPPCATLSVDLDALHGFLSSVEHAYRRDIPYHTRTHAADVLQAAVYMLRASWLPGPAVTPLLELAVMIAAVAHDAAHPGVNADFLQRTGDPLALLYNDTHVLEQMHASVCFRLLAMAEGNLLQGLAPEQRVELRARVIHMILQTDMKIHYEMMSRLNEVEPWLGCEPGIADAELQFALGVLLHAADLSGPTKPGVVVRWSRRVAEEFFRQGERERAAGLKVSDGFDREASGHLWATRNAAFVRFIVLPMYEALQAVSPDAKLQPCIDGIHESLMRLDSAPPDLPMR